MSLTNTLPTNIRDVVSINLKSARSIRGISLSGLAEISGIGKATLSGIEKGEGNPTIETLWNLARSLNVPFGQLIASEREDATVYTAAGISAKLINREIAPRVIETFVMELAPHTKRLAEPHMAGVIEQALMLQGRMLIGTSSEPLLISSGQTARFKSDVQHLYQSLDEPCTVQISVIYPEPDNQASESHDKIRDWPVTNDDWEGLNVQVDRMGLEARQGIVARKLTFEKCQLEAQTALDVLSNNVRAAGVKVECSQLYLVYETRPMIVSLSRQGNHAKIYPTAPGASDALRQALDICNLSFSPWRSLSQYQKNELEDIAQSESVCLATIAAEALTRHGYPCVPGQAAPKYEKATRADSFSEKASFEDRINVDAYAAYELVHPAYAKQAVAIANELQSYLAGAPASIIDVGTGPGLPLKMVLELLPELNVTAVDPSSVAFHHLKKLFRHYANVTPIQASITDLDKPETPYTAAISVGASHHLDTLEFLHSTRRQLASGGLFIIADEMITEFENSSVRSRNLIAHHLQYIADTLIDIPTSALETAEAELVALIRKNVPLAIFEASHCAHAEAENRTRKLLEHIKELDLPLVSSDSLIAFYRLHFLELEALVAGLDYEVEQKTYPRCFRDLANAAGFEVLRHSRLYATSGRSEWDAGTHLFVLKAL
ncbi:methyltransferase domain-containing protein [Pseudomonas koreensis]